MSRNAKKEMTKVAVETSGEMMTLETEEVVVTDLMEAIEEEATPMAVATTEKVETEVTIKIMEIEMVVEMEVIKEETLTREEMAEVVEITEVEAVTPEIKEDVDN